MMQFLPNLSLDVGGTASDFISFVEQSGGQITIGEAAPDTSIVPVKASGEALSNEGIQKLTAFHLDDRLLRVLVQLNWSEAELCQRFGDPTVSEKAFRLWAWKQPRWSIETVAAKEKGTVLDVKFLDEAVKANILSENHVSNMYKKLNQKNN